MVSDPSPSIVITSERLVPVCFIVMVFPDRPETGGRVRVIVPSASIRFSSAVMVLVELYVP